MDGDLLNTKINEAVVDVEEMAAVRLQHSPYRSIRRITCEFEGGVLTLHGRVSTFHYKQLAQVAVADVPGVVSIHNCIDVESP